MVTEYECRLQYVNEHTLIKQYWAAVRRAVGL